MVRRVSIISILLICLLTPALCAPIFSSSSDENGTAEEKTHALVAVLIMAAITGICFWNYMLEHVRFIQRWIPECCLTVFLGAIVAAVYSIIEFANDGKPTVWDRFLSLNRELFQLVLLPMVLLESGFSLRKETFFSNLGPILCYAIVGTLISTTVCALGFLGFSHIGAIPKLEPLEATAYASVISAVDPVASLAALASVGAPRTLFTLIFGESILNDSVSIVLFESILEIAKEDSISALAIAKAIWFFVYSFVGAIFIGVLSGILAAWITSRSRLHKIPMLEVFLLLVSSYAPYMISEALGLSGVTSILFAGIVVSRYAMCNVSLGSQETVHQMLKLLAYLSDSVIFFYIGSSLFTGSMAQLNMITVLCTILFIMVGRAVNIIGLTFIINLCRKPERRIPFKYQVVMYWSGLRGAVAYVLALQMIWHPGMWASTTVIVVLFTILLFGITTEPLVKKLGLAAAKDSAEHGEASKPLLGDEDAEDEGEGEGEGPLGGAMVSVQITDEGGINFNMHADAGDESWLVKMERRLGNFLRKTRAGGRQRSRIGEDVHDMAVLLGLAAQMQEAAEEEEREERENVLANVAVDM